MHFHHSPGNEFTVSIESDGGNSEEELLTVTSGSGRKSQFKLREQ
jgi:hypothetical protein